MQTPLVTVYITNYNYDKYIKQAVESVLKQTYDNLEIFIIDDGSTDRSKTIIDEYVNNPQIKIVYQQNKGLIRTNNIALRLAQGKYIIRLDADDYFDQNALSVMVAEMEKDNALGLVFPNYFIVDGDGNIINYRARLEEETNSVKDIPAHGACTLVRTKFLKAIGGYDERYTSQDGFYLWVNFIKNYKIKNINTPLFYYRQHGNNLTANKDKIINTRNEIINNIYYNNEHIISTVLAILPIRGPKYNHNSISLEFLNGKTILEWKIDETLKAETIGQIVVTTPDEDIIRLVDQKYQSNKKVIIHKRKPELAILNTGLVETVKSIFRDLPNLNKYSVFTTLSVRFPFFKSSLLNSAIKAMKFYNTDSLISVEIDNNKYFQKTDNGLTPILNQEKFTKLERDDLYRYSGGMIMVKKAFFDTYEIFFGGKTGHVIINKVSALEISDKFSFEIAEMLINKNLLL